MEINGHDEMKIKVLLYKWKSASCESKTKYTLKCSHKKLMTLTPYKYTLKCSYKNLMTLTPYKYETVNTRSIFYKSVLR